MGVVVRRYIYFLILLIPTPLAFHYCSGIYVFVIYVVHFLHSINTHTGDYGRPMEAI